MMKFRTRLVFGLMIAILFVLAALGILLGQILKGIYMDQLEERLGKEASLAALAFQDKDENEWQTFAEELGDALDVRVTVIKENGEIAGETLADAEAAENYLQHPEIEQADENGGTTIRYSEARGEDLFYYAYPFSYGENENAYVRLALPVDHLGEVNQQIWMFLGVSFSLAFIIIVSLSYRIANQLTRPIGQVTEVAKELAKGNFKARTYEGTKDEVGQLTRSINILAYNLDQITRQYKIQQERLEALIDHMGSGLIFINDRGDISLVNRYCKDIFNENTDEWLQKLYYQVIEDKHLIQLIQQIFLTEEKVKDQVQLTTRLQVQHYDVYGAPIVGDRDKLRGIVLVLHDITELKKLEQVRKDFVANVSHELKTPVTSLKGFTETLLDGAMEDKNARKQFLDIIWKESDRLQDLISDLLELSKIEQEYFELNWQQVHVNQSIKDVVDLLQPKAEEKNITLTFTAPETIHMDGDAARFKQIVINLISNAIVYTPEEGVIDVSVKAEPDTVIVKVQDTGIGMNEQELPRIFERFYRVNKDRSRHSGGTGLGLAIVKHLAEAHHAEIEVDSTKHKGTTFTIRFPKHHNEEE
ncbi:two-component system, OmpR family, phosphate regulon sensor histidine kinase PhoR [Alteribacillus persepolensis]|uniref:histidine kinase n=1 Tax=Alteribacillus persepolensis TaxID=568899 RepID=A0A1G8BJC7_9BACI|nr:ATP-binding protein [Alteribacillus persepolensis]SDH33269.1 two-component system, OmpR family, phosphate regulon sensor histidine kinase PhoR [Alteribacillus persepolensis]